MAEPLVVIVPHKLGKEEALRRIRPALGNASQDFPVLKVEQEVWSDDRMDFKVRALGQTADGNVQVAGESVRLEVTLPWLLHKFAQAVQKAISGRGRTLLAKE
jgi:hypothetical protein